MTTTPNQTTREEIRELAIAALAEMNSVMVEICKPEPCNPSPIIIPVQREALIAALQSPTDKEGDRLNIAEQIARTEAAKLRNAGTSNVIEAQARTADRIADGIAAVSAHLSRSIVGEGE